MKKFVSTLMASVLAVSAFPIVSASAVETPNTLSVSTEILGESVTVDETVIPEGSVAVTVSVSNNDGFSSSTTKLDVNAADVVTDENGRPVFVSGNVLDSSIVKSVEKDNVVAFVSASAEKTYDDGKMFTFFVSDNYSGVDIIREEGNSHIRPALYAYRIGDVDDDGYIDAADASDVLGAISTFSGGKVDGVNLPISEVDAHLSTYFPRIRYAQAANTDKNLYINYRDAENILDCYGYLATGYTFEEAYEILSVNYNYCGEIVIPR